MLTFFLQSLNTRSTMLIGLETCLILCSIALATSLSLGAPATLSTMGSAGGVLKAILIAIICQACLYYHDLYDLRIISDRRELFARTFHALAAASLILAAVYFVLPDLGIGEGVVIAAAVFVTATIPGWRVAFDAVARRAAPRERLLIVGTSTAALSLAAELTDRRSVLGLEIVGFVSDDATAKGVGRLLGGIGDIPAIVRARNIDRVVVSLSDARGHAADGRVARDEDVRGSLRLPGVDLRAIHGQDRGREPASELAHLLGGISHDAACPGGQAQHRYRRGVRRVNRRRCRSWRWSRPQ